MRVLSEHACFGGVVGYYEHDAAATKSPMRFAVYQPPQARNGPVPVLFYLAGLTCTEETFMIKGGAQRLAAEHGLMLVAPDTSPRGLNLPGEDDDWDFGTGAGFYIDATRAPFAGSYALETWVADELRALVTTDFPGDDARVGIFGHSMGGHGALTLSLKHPGRYQSVSAFAPICAPTQCPWGEKAFTGYLGDDRAAWAAHDACALIRALPEGAPRPPLLVDQGLADGFLEVQLHPHLLEAACADTAYPLTLRRHAGYDHGYFFISTFMADHLEHHARTLCG
ncbi:MAG: S-formylglutathione hydrolase [Rhodobacterales bacterium]|nr:S-formylglutathione hydrolase [Rhodobacterales bacterium]